MTFFLAGKASLTQSLTHFGPNRELRHGCTLGASKKDKGYNQLAITLEENGAKGRLDDEYNILNYMYLIFYKIFYANIYTNRLFRVMNSSPAMARCWYDLTVFCNPV
jgi:hypothetical protein